MKILVLNYEFPPIGGGGGAVCANLCAALAGRGHQVQVQTAWIRGLPKRERKQDYQIFRSYAFRARADRCSVPEMFLYLLGNLWPTIHRIRRYRPDLIHAHFAVPTGVLALAAHLLFGIPYVLTLHLGDVPGAMPRETDRLFRYLKPLTVPIWKRAAAITAVSDHVRDLAEKAYGFSVSTIYNGVPFDPNAARSVAPVAGESVQILFAGRFQSQKNLPFLMRVMARLKDLPWQLHLLGDGPLRGELERLREQLGLTEQVHFHGWLPEARVQARLAASHLMVLPSVSEGLPMIAVEAMAHGLPLVGSDIGGLRETVSHDRHGLLVPVGDEAAFAQALRTLIPAPERRREMSIACLSNAGRFHMDHISGQYEDLFERVLNP